MSNKKSNRVPTEQQKYRIYKNITEPALLAKNKPEEVSDIVKAIKEALGIKPPPVGNTTRIKEVFGNEDVALQQKVIQEEKAIRIKNRRETLDKRFLEKRRSKSASLIKAVGLRKIAQNEYNQGQSASILQNAVRRNQEQKKIGKTNDLYDENNKRIGIDPQSYFKGRPTNQEKAIKKGIKKRKEALFASAGDFEPNSIFE